MAYRVAICDDSTTDAAYVREILNGWAARRQPGAQAEIFPSAERFLFQYAQDKNFDILLLDIEMGAIYPGDLGGSAEKIHAVGSIDQCNGEYERWLLRSRIRS